MDALLIASAVCLLALLWIALQNVEDTDFNEPGAVIGVVIAAVLVVVPLAYVVLTMFGVGQGVA